MFSPPWRASLLWIVPGLILATSPLAAQTQTRDSVQTVPLQAGPLIRGTVTDSANHPLTGAEVLATNDKGKVLARTHTGSKGTFQLRYLKSGQAYVFVARRVGYASGSSDVMHLTAKDTIDLQFVLDPTETTLASVRVVGQYTPAYHINADEIAKHADRDALDVVLNERPRMLGDTYKECMPDTSHLTFDTRYIRPLPRAMSPDRTLPFRLYINGIWHGERSIKDILADIPAEDIAEMNYVNCWDKLRPELRNSLMIVLKPGVAY
jgi:hypothetical protein